MYNQSNFYDHSINLKLSSSISSLNSDEDVDITTIMNRKDRRRELHTQAEQRRRDAIKNGYDSLMPLIHPIPESHGTKLSKTTILQRTISHIRSLSEQANLKNKELEDLKNELIALRIMNSNYEEMAKCNKSKLKTEEENPVPENVKFEIFGQFMQQLFQSFDKNTKFDDFGTAATTIIHWVEEYCKPQNLNILIELVLTDVLTNYHRSQDDIPMDSMASNEMWLNKYDHLHIYDESISEYQSDRHFRPVNDFSNNFCSSLKNDSKPFRKRQSVPLVTNSLNFHSQTSLPNIFQSLNSPIDDDFLSFSPNALELGFLDSLDQNNLIDDLWLPLE